MIKVAIPVDADEGLESKLAGHFGRARMFAIAELEEDPEAAGVNVVANQSTHFGGKGYASQALAGLEPNVVITAGMGRRAIDIMQAQNIAVLKGTQGETVSALLRAYVDDKLPELTEGCAHSHHH